MSEVHIQTKKFWLFLESILDQQCISQSVYHSAILCLPPHFKVLFLLLYYSTVTVSDN